MSTLLLIYFHIILNDIKTQVDAHDNNDDDNVEDDEKSFSKCKSLCSNLVSSFKMLLNGVSPS